MGNIPLHLRHRKASFVIIFWKIEFLHYSSFFPLHPSSHRLRRRHLYLPVNLSPVNTPLLSAVPSPPHHSSLARFMTEPYTRAPPTWPRPGGRSLHTVYVYGRVKTRCREKSAGSGSRKTTVTAANPTTAIDSRLSDYPPWKTRISVVQLAPDNSPLCNTRAIYRPHLSANLDYPPLSIILQARLSATIDYPPNFAWPR